MIEYGIAGGASLRMWRDFFSPTTRIVGFDINLDGDPHLPNLDCYYANQDSIPSLQRGISDSGITSVDVIVEDGGHLSTQQRNSLRVSWPLLVSGGIYILEDLHTNILHWYPKSAYHNESPTMFEDLYKASLGLPNSLPINTSEISQILFFMQPKTTSMTSVLYKV